MLEFDPGPGAKTARLSGRAQGFRAGTPGGGRGPEKTRFFRKKPVFFGLRVPPVRGARDPRFGPVRGQKPPVWPRDPRSGPRDPRSGGPRGPGTPGLAVFGQKPGFCEKTEKNRKKPEKNRFFRLFRKNRGFAVFGKNRGFRPIPAFAGYFLNG